MKSNIYIITLVSILITTISCNQDAEWENLNVKESVKREPVINWEGIADSCTFVLIDQFMNKEKGTFWKSPQNISGGSFNIYWQQAHAIDVVIYSYKRIKNKDSELAKKYESYFKLWFQNKANNYNHDPNDETGFLNSFTDDMCWICLTLIHMSEATGDESYVEMAKSIYDKHIITRAWSDSKGTGLPWKDNDKNRNACTNAPGCLVAAKLYQRYGEETYLSEAKMLYNYVATNLLKADGRVEEPPLSYTQGTFGEACRQLYHITGEREYMRKAEHVINYAVMSDRCLTNWILRNEGESMDQSIFKAVFIPYAVNLALDEAAFNSTRKRLTLFLEDNAKALWKNLDRTSYPEMYCNYYWGTQFPSDKIASMGAQASGASLMEGMVRLKNNQKE